jgi:hypothetical protein
MTETCPFCGDEHDGVRSEIFASIGDDLEVTLVVSDPLIPVGTEDLRELARGLIEVADLVDWERSIR